MSKRKSQSFERVCRWCGKVHSTPKTHYCSKECADAMYRKKSRISNEKFMKNKEWNSYYVEDGKRLIRMKTSSKKPNTQPWEGKLPEIIACTLNAY